MLKISTGARISVSSHNSFLKYSQKARQDERVPRCRLSVRLPSPFNGSILGASYSAGVLRSIARVDISTA